MNQLRVTSTRYRRPHRPRLIRTYNRLAGLTPRLQRELSPDDLLESARRRSGFRSFVDERFVPALQQLVATIEAEAALHPLGRWITAERLIGVLGNRLRVEQLLQDHPAIARSAIAPAVVITGLQRTGTTLLHRLLAADPETRSLSSWEALNPAPLPPSPWLGGDPAGRVRLARISQRVLAFMAPDFFAIHPVEATAPEEDSLLLDYSLLSPVAEATLRVPSYSVWLDGQDMRPAYQEMALLLRLLQWQRPARHWVLKTPAHLEYLDHLLAVLPEVVIVQTHREPAQTLPSCCSMIAHGRGVFSDAVDPTEIGQQWLARQARMVHRAIDLRQDPAVDGKMIDVAYRDLLRDPLGQVERIYRFADRSLGTAARQAMQQGLRANPQHRHGRHRYRLEDFGLDRRQVAQAFEPYRDRFADWIDEASPAGGTDR